MNNETTTAVINYPVAKAASSLGFAALSFNIGDIASAAALIYSMILIGEWIYKRLYLRIRPGDPGDSK